jgi:integrase
MINKIQVIFGQLISLAHDLNVTCVRREDLGFSNLKVIGQSEIFLNDRQMRNLMLQCKESSNVNLFPIVQLLALTGARKREVLDLQWQNVFIDQGYFLVPKSKNGMPRKVFLNEASLKILKNLFDSRNEENVFVFPNPNTGKPYRCIHYAWNIARKKAGFQNLRIHDLRHSFASALVNKGVAIYDIQHLLGHQSIKTTQRYAHLDDHKLKSSANLVGQYFSLN